MPTPRRRHAITETDQVEHALRLAAPLENEQRMAQNSRMDVLRRAQVALEGCYSEHYLDELREDWPA